MDTHGAPLASIGIRAVIHFRPSSSINSLHAVLPSVLCDRDVYVRCCCQLLCIKYVQWGIRYETGVCAAGAGRSNFVQNKCQTLVLVYCDQKFNFQGMTE